MQTQKMPWDEDWSQQTVGGATAYPTITIPRDPRQTAREDAANARAAQASQLAAEAAAREQTRFGERNKPNMPAGYMMGPDGKTAIRIPGLPPEQGTPAPQTPADLEAVRNEALDKIRLGLSLQQRSKNGWFTTGVGSSLAGWFRGTPAYDLAEDTKTLKNAGALTRVMEMSKQNGGKNPLTPLSNSDFEALSNSLTNLDPGQSDEQYQANVQRTIDLYKRAYAGAGGKDLEGDLDPSKRKRRDVVPLMGISASPPPLSGQNASGPGSPPPVGPIATGSTKADRNPEREKALDALLRSGASNDTINATSKAMGGMDIDGSKLDLMRDAVRRGYKGPTFDTAVAAPTTAWNRFAASPLGTGIYAAVDSGLGGFSDELASLAGGGDLADLNARKEAAFAANPTAAIVGQTAGTIGSLYGLGKLGQATGIASRIANPALIGDVAFGTMSGVGQSNDNRLLGGTVGGVGALAGNYAGNAVAGGVGRLARSPAGMMFQNRVRRAIGVNPLPATRPLNGIDNTLLGAINQSGPDAVTASLTEAHNLGIPMSLADTNPNLRELAGAAVRRSPTAASYAENALLPRSRGQFDRFAAAVEQNLGPVTNIPQRSADLTAQGRTAAASLYDRAYAAPVVSTPELEATLNTPFGRQALSRANTIAANERRNPMELGFLQDEAGNIVLNPRPNQAIANHLAARAELDAAQEAYRAAKNQPGSMDAARNRLTAARDGLRKAEFALNQAPDPSLPANVPGYTTQTLDYVKRGMDDVLEQQRNPITGRLVLDEAGRAQNQVRSQFLDQIDGLSPDYAAARAAYAGPAASRDALAQGGQAYTLHPDELAVQVGRQTPEHLGQMQLGYRGALMDHAGRVRDNANPWEATLGSPVARDRLGTVFPDNTGVDRLLRQRDLESQLAQTNNGILGNSRTSQRQIADEAFSASNPLVEGALHAGAAVATGGASIPGTAARLAGAGFKKWMARDRNRMSIARADEITPLLLNTDPSAGLSTVSDLLARQRTWEEMVARTTPRRPLGMFGRALGGQAAVIPLNR